MKYWLSRLVITGGRPAGQHRKVVHGCLGMLLLHHGKRDSGGSRKSCSCALVAGNVQHSGIVH